MPDKNDDTTASVRVNREKDARLGVSVIAECSITELCSAITKLRDRRTQYPGIQTGENDFRLDS